MRHRSLDPERNQTRFFDFSVLEIGVYDYAAQIDHAIAATGFPQVVFYFHRLRGGQADLRLFPIRYSSSQTAGLRCIRFAKCYCHAGASSEASALQREDKSDDFVRRTSRRMLLPKSNNRHHTSYGVAFGERNENRNSPMRRRSKFSPTAHSGLKVTVFFFAKSVSTAGSDCLVECLRSVQPTLLKIH